MASYKTKLIILNRQDFSESDRVLTVFSLAHGMHKIIAKGSRKSLAHLGGKIEPYYNLFANLVEGKSFDIITDAEIIYSYQGIRLDLEKLRIAYNISNLFKNILKEKESHQKIYFDLQYSLEILDTIKFNTAWLYIISSLIQNLGYAPDTHECSICRKPLKLPLSWLVSGGFVHEDCSQLAFKLSDLEAKIIKVLLTRGHEITKIQFKKLSKIEEIFEQYLAFHTGLDLIKIRKEDNGLS